MTSEQVLAVCAAISLILLMITTVVGGAIWIMNGMNRMKKEILTDVGEMVKAVLTDLHDKHQDNTSTVKALEQLVMRHDLILEPEFNGSGRSQYVSKRQKQ